MIGRYVRREQQNNKPDAQRKQFAIHIMMTGCLDILKYICLFYATKSDERTHPFRGESEAASEDPASRCLRLASSFIPEKKRAALKEAKL